MSGLCKDCRHWHVSEDAFGPNLQSWGRCGLGEGERGGPVKETLAYADDFEGFSATLVTAPNFGCVQHEPRDG